MPKISPSKGFSLIELLVSIMIIAIIATLGANSYSQFNKSARDAKRKQDLRLIAIALDLYKQQNGRYPCSVTGTPDMVYSTGGTGWIKDLVNINYLKCTGGKPFDQKYISVLPVDPVNKYSGPPFLVKGSYVYGYFGPACGIYAGGDFYLLETQLESENDPDSVKNTNPLYCDGVTHIWSDYGNPGGAINQTVLPNTFVILSSNR